MRGFKTGCVFCWGMVSSAQLNYSGATQATYDLRDKNTIVRAHAVIFVSVVCVIHTRDHYIFWRDFVANRYVAVS